jgi:hypothetical protein
MPIHERIGAYLRGVAWVHGTDIGIASSADGGKSWQYRGIAAAWTRKATLLKEPGVRPDDAALGQHADVLVHDGRAFIFYFTHPGRKPGEKKEFGGTEPYEWKRTSLQVAELEMEGGEPVCDRNKALEYSLHAPGDEDSG